MLKDGGFEHVAGPCLSSCGLSPSGSYVTRSKGLAKRLAAGFSRAIGKRSLRMRRTTGTLAPEAPSDTWRGEATE
ncbi:MAG: hypothetical protein ACI80V_003007 [Rhodothermales bacterium]|jgi:hypothetical protein